MRVIAGSRRSLPLKAPTGMDTRPTQDRTKETLFNIINNNIFDHTTIRLIDVDFSTKMVNPNNLLYNDITQDEKIMYQVIINYPFIHQAIIECEYLMQKNIDRCYIRILFAALIVAI